MRIEANKIDAYLLQQIARAICAHTDTRSPGDPDPIMDQPDDLVWLKIDGRDHLAPRWVLYQDSARAALDSIGAPHLVRALTSIVDQVERGKGAERLVADRAFDDITKLAHKALATLGF